VINLQIYRLKYLAVLTRKALAMNKFTYYLTESKPNMMKRLIIALLLGLSFLAPAQFTFGSIETSTSVRKDIVVYITRTGAKYHVSSCRYLRQSKIKTTKKTAMKDGYSACKVCAP
jgi:hypothetical protein